MNKPMQNHIHQLLRFKTMLIECGITDNKNNEVFYYEPDKRSIYHIVIVGLMDNPICVKLAHADSYNTNQSDRYPTQILRMPKNMKCLFVFDGAGFTNHKYKSTKYHIRSLIGTEWVLSMNQCRQKLLQLIEEKALKV